MTYANGPEGQSNRGLGWKNKIFLLTLGMAVIIVLAYAFGFFEGTKKRKKIECLGGDALSAPAFILPDLNGNKVDLMAFKGKVIVVEFWATWCGPCREEIPLLNDLYHQYKKDGLVVIGISLDRREPEGVQKFLEKLKVDYINVMGDEEVFEAYSGIPGLGPIRGIPATFLIDRQGRICHRFLGLTERRVLENAIQSVL
jgi:peroxiredoxin